MRDGINGSWRQNREKPDNISAVKVEPELISEFPLRRSCRITVSMHCSSTYAGHIESRVATRLSSIGADRIALLGAGKFTRGLLSHIGDDHQFAGALVTGIIDESGAEQPTEMQGIPLLRSAREADCDAVVVSTPMHEPEILRRSGRGEFGAMPIIGPHTIADPRELRVDTLLLPESAWFGLDLPGLLEQAGKSFILASATGLPGFDLIDTAPFWSEHRDTPADRLVWDDLDLHDVVKGSAACVLGRADIDPVADRQTLVQLVDEGIRIYESAVRCFSGAGAPSSVVVANGLLHHQRAVAEAALRCGTRVFAVESSCFPALCRVERITDFNRMTSAPHVQQPAIELDEARRSRVTSYFEKRTPHTEVRVDSAPQPAPGTTESIRGRLGIDENNRVLLLLGQVCTDTALVYRAPFVNDVVRLAQLASEVVSGFPRWTLLIKPHPKEASGVDPVAGNPYLQGAFDRLRLDPIVQQPHVRLVEPSEHSVYALMRLADAGLTINSQSAMEMVAMYAKPVCLVGQAPFGGAGFTRDATSTAEITSALKAVLESPVLAARQHDLALRYVHDELFEHLVPTDESAALNIMPRRNPALAALMSGEQIVCEDPSRAVPAGIP